MSENTNKNLQSEQTSQAEIDDIMKKYDKESNTRMWVGIPKILIIAFMAIFSIYCIFMTLFSTALPEKHPSLS